jgi:hypothetical protein
MTFWTFDEFFRPRIFSTAIPPVAASYSGDSLTFSPQFRQFAKM